MSSFFAKFAHHPEMTRIPRITAAERTSGTKPAAQPEAATETVALEAGHVYVHCYFNNTFKNMLIRIWKSTFLIDQASGAKSELVHVENITYAPEWTSIPDNQLFHFLLIFSALPKGCMKFDLLEDIPQTGGFHITDIARNEQDVYRVDV